MYMRYDGESISSVRRVHSTLRRAPARTTLRLFLLLLFLLQSLLLRILQRPFPSCAPKLNAKLIVANQDLHRFHGAIPGVCQRAHSAPTRPPERGSPHPTSVREPHGSLHAANCIGSELSRENPPGPRACRSRSRSASLVFNGLPSPLRPRQARIVPGTLRQRVPEAPNGTAPPTTAQL
jgi:hypothetical protein